MKFVRVFVAATAIWACVLTAGCTAPRATSPATPSGAQTSPDMARPSAASDTRQQFQTISGLGVNANVHSWNNGQLKPAIDLIAGLGQVTWRVIIDKADWETTRDDAEPGTVGWDRYSAIYDRGKMADLWNTITYIQSKPGQQIIVNVMGGVPDWMGGTHIDPALEDSWVHMISSMAYYGRTVKKLDFTLLGPMNETDWNGVEGPQVGPEQYVRLLHKLSDRLDQLGLDDIRFVGPDTASAPAANSDYLPALNRDPVVMAKLAHLGIHSYDGGSGSTEEAISKSAYPKLDYWVTEFAGPCPGCDDGKPNPANWQSAADTAAYALSLLQQGASGLLLYDAWDGFYEHHNSIGYWGALAQDTDTGRYTPRKSFYVLQQLIEFVPRNAVRIALTSNQPGVTVVAFQDDASGRITVFGQNNGSYATDVQLKVPGIPGDVELENFRTDAANNVAKDQSVELSSGTATLTAKAESVFTLTGTLPKG